MNLQPTSKYSHQSQNLTDNLVPFAVKPAQENFPQRLVLKLSDSYETSVYYYPAKEQTQPNLSSEISSAKPCAKLPVIFFHGIQSHPGWFSPSATFLASKGYPVFQITRRGNGDCISDRGAAKSATQLFNDIKSAHDFIESLIKNRQTEFPDFQNSDRIKFHYIGASWGGKLLASYFAKNPNRQTDAQSLTLLYPGICPQVDVPFSTKILIAGALIFCPHKLFDIPLSDNNLFTENPAMLHFLEKDSRSLRRATAKFLFASKILDKYISRSKAGIINCRTNLILSQNDKIIDNKKTSLTVQKLTSNRARILEIPGEHTLDFEENKSEFFEALLQCLE